MVITMVRTKRNARPLITLRSIVVQLQSTAGHMVGAHTIAISALQRQKDMMMKQHLRINVEDPKHFATEGGVDG